MNQFSTRAHAVIVLSLTQRVCTDSSTATDSSPTTAEGQQQQQQQVWILHESLDLILASPSLARSLTHMNMLYWVQGLRP